MRGTSIATVVLPAPEGPTSATVSPGATRSETSRRIHSLGSSPPGVPGVSSDGSETWLPGGCRNHTWSNSTRPCGLDEVDGAGLVGDRGGEVEHLEHPLERHERGEDVDARVRELRERLVHLPDVHHERDHGAGGDRAGDREVAADEVDDRGADRGDESERDEQDPAVDRGAHADVANAGGAAREAIAFGVAPAEELGEHRAGDVEALDGEVVHLRVELHALARELLHARADAARGKDERREHDQRQEREPPVELEHDREHDREVDDVRHDGAERGRDGLLRADHVVVQA